MLLALDLGSKTGWARWAPGMSQPIFGTEVFSDPDHGSRAFDFRDWLYRKSSTLKVTEFWVEEYLSAASGKSRNYGNELWTPYQHLCVAEVAVAVGAKVNKVHMATWRKHFIGRGVAPKTVQKSARRTWFKDHAIQRARLLGWKVKGDDEAEALGILDYARARTRPAYAAATTDLFARAAAP